jgi:energy-coupling factor transporter ATP-binding protein EcfA2
MLEADNLECVRGERRLFAGLGFRLEAGELLYLQGKNGAGKTSLLRMLIGLLPPEAGEIRWKGQSIKSDDEFRADLCYLGHLNAIKEELTPLENLLAAARLADEELVRGRRARCAGAGRPGRPRGPRLQIPVARPEAPRRAGPAGQGKAAAVDTRRTLRRPRRGGGRLAGRHHFRPPATRRPGRDDHPPAGRHPGRHRPRIAAQS